MFRMYRGFLTAACAAVVFFLVGCSGGATEPVQIVKCADGSSAPNNDTNQCVVVKPETVSFSSITPSNGSVIAQSPSAYPMANVSISATAVSTKTGIISNVTYVVDGNIVPAQTNVSVGTHTLHITAVAPSGMTVDTTITFTVPQAGFNIHLTVATATGERAPQGAWAIIEGVDSASFDATGNVFVPSGFAIKQSNAKVVIRGDAGMIPFLAHVPSKFFNNLSVVGVPNTFTIPSGTYSGQVVPIHLDSAYTVVPSHGADSLSFYLRWLQPNGAYAYNVGSWKTFPVKVAFFQYAVSALDSIGVQKSLDSLNTVFGFKVFVFADTTDINANGGVKIYLNNTNRESGGSTQGWEGDYAYGVVYLQYGSWPVGTFAIGGTPIYELFQAEMIHPFSTGHTCSWVSLSASSCLFNSGHFISARDVAYILLMTRIRALERLHNTRFSLAYAHQGERMTQGLSEEKVAYVDANGNIVP